MRQTHHEQTITCTHCHESRNLEAGEYYSTWTAKHADEHLGHTDFDVEPNWSA